MGDIPPELASINLQRGNAKSFLQHNVTDLFSLKDRNIVVTGGGRGIGLAICFAIAESGGNVAIIDYSIEESPGLKKLCGEYNVQVQTYRSDVTDFQILKDTFDEIATDFGSVDGLVTAAGVCQSQPFARRTVESVMRTMNVNFMGTYFAAQLAVGKMKTLQPRKNNIRGSLVFIASVAGYLASDNQATSDYCASKGAVHSLARELGVELAEDNIRVNTISPGYILTDMTQRLIDDNEQLGIVMNDTPPLGRIGDLTDLKGPSVYLLSDASAYQTASDILVTGGIHAGRRWASSV